MSALSNLEMSSFGCESDSLFGAYLTYEECTHVQRTIDHESTGSRTRQCH
jgi:hypothetical protein